MDCPIFSQIPSVVLKKLEPTRKRVKFLDLPDLRIHEELEEVTPSLQNKTDIQKSVYDTLDAEILSPAIKEPYKSVLKNSSSNKHNLKADESISICKETSDAIVQVDSKTEFANKSTQTELSLLQPPEIEILSYEQQRAHYEAHSIAGYKPMFAIPKKKGKPPPLKIGLVLPKGRKRKVYYPDDDENLR